MENPIEIIPEDMRNGIYLFNDLPAAKYKFHISYGRFTDELYIDVPEDGEFSNVKFTALFDLKTNLLNSRGNLIQDENFKINVIRNGEILFDLISPDKTITVPPGKYTVQAHSNGKLVGSKIVELNSDKEINIVTKIKPILPTLVTGIVLLFIIEIRAINS